MVFMGRVVTSKTKIVTGLDSANATDPVKSGSVAPLKKEAKDQAPEAEKPKRGKGKN